MQRLDSTDFLLKLTGHKPIVVHEFEGNLALMWHIAALILESKLEVDLPPIIV